MKKWMFLLVIAMLLVGCGNGGEEGKVTPTPGQSQQQVGKTEPAGFVFEYEGVKIWMDMEASAVIAALGEADQYFEAPSCAFEGLDKQYTYGSIELDTYEVEGKDYVSCIYFRDDLVATPEGVGLYMTKEDMVKAYGEDYKEEFGMYVYEKDGMKLKFIIKDNEITSIEYASGVLEVE